MFERVIKLKVLHNAIFRAFAPVSYFSKTRAFCEKYRNGQNVNLEVPTKNQFRFILILKIQQTDN